MIKSVRCFFLRLRESEINFVFCEWVLFYPLATKQYTVLFLPNSHVNLEPRVSCALHNSLPRAKDGKRQKCLFNSGSPKSVSFLGREERNGVFIINF